MFMVLTGKIFIKMFSIFFFVLHSTGTLCSKICFIYFIKKRVQIIRSIDRRHFIVLIHKVKGSQTLPL